MTRSTRARRLTLAFCGIALAGAVAAQTPVQITQYPIGASPIPLTVGPDGNFWIWFSGGSTVGRVTPSGVETAFITALPFPGSSPGHCVDAHDGNVWCSNTGGNIVRVSAATGASTVFPLSPAGAGATDLTLGPDGALWFADYGLNAIGRMTLEGDVTEYPVPAEFIGPHSITLGPDGALWFTSDSSQVGRMDATGGGFRYYNLPQYPNGAASATSAIRTGPDGNLWLGVTALMGPSPIIRVTPAGVITEFPLPHDNDAVMDIVAGPDGAIWFTQEQASQIGRITMAGEITEYDLPPLSGPVGIAVGWDRAIWFTELSGNLGRLSGGPLAGTAIPALGPALIGLLAVALAASGWLLLRLR